MTQNHGDTETAAREAFEHIYARTRNLTREPSGMYKEPEIEQLWLAFSFGYGTALSHVAKDQEKK